MKYKAILFGAGKLGEMAISILKNEFDIIYFCDNDKKKWGKEILGIKVISPKQLNEFKNAKIIITSKYSDDILKQIYNVEIFDTSLLLNQKNVNDSLYEDKNEIICELNLNYLLKKIEKLNDLKDTILLIDKNIKESTYSNIYDLLRSFIDELNLEAKDLKFNSKVLIDGISRAIKSINERIYNKEYLQIYNIFKNELCSNFNSICRQILLKLQGKNFKLLEQSGSALSIKNSDDAWYKNRTSMFNILDTTDVDIMFLGDSITEGCEWHEMFISKCIVNRGILGDTTYGLLNRVKDLYRLRPKKIFILIGVNDLIKDKNIEYIVENYNRILYCLTTNLPETQIYIQSLTPIVVNSNLNWAPGSKVSNEIIQKLNSKLRLLSNLYNLIYIDLYSEFFYANSNGLNSRMTADGVHLNGAAYKKWSQIIEKYIK